MAHGLSPDTIGIQQALHGYADGHRLLASSVTLKPRDQKTMLIMSDVSGPNAGIDEGGYVTGYPLSESGFYALACTWAATEMPRPGCVWSHTLLIDFSDLATLPGMMFLLTAFRRPDVGVQYFKRTLNIDVQDDARPAGDFEETTLRRVASALYSHPRERIFASSGPSSEETAFQLWAQQWPRLRRNFRFCTLAFGDRSTESGPFDLQFVPSKEKSVRARFAALTDADRIEPSQSPWVDAIVSDLYVGTDGNLRIFLRDVGSDLASGREVFVPLCRLYRLIPEFANSARAIDEALDILETSFSSDSGSSLRARLLSEISRHPGAIGAGALRFLLDHFDLLEATATDTVKTEVGRILWAREPNELMKLLDAGAKRHELAETVLRTLPQQAVLDGARQIPDSIPSLVELRPTLIEDTGLWAIPGEWHQSAFRQSTKDPDRIPTVIAAILSAGRTDLAPQVTATFGSARVLRAVSGWAVKSEISIPADAVRPWLKAALVDASATAEVLSGSDPLDRGVLALIARLTTPDFVPNTVGEDPWWTSVRTATGSVSGELCQYLAAYLFVRALGYRSRNQAELLVFAFDDLYLPALNSRLSKDAWDLVEYWLPKPWLFFDWDYCQRIRDATIDAFLSRDLSPYAFGRISTDDSVFGQLVRSMARTGKGRRYLERCRYELAQQISRSPRIAIIDNAI